jgi:hypothetical protein
MPPIQIAAPSKLSPTNASGAVLPENTTTAATKQLGVLLASGMIVGESLLGVVIAAVVVFSGKTAPLALVGDSFEGAAIWIGGIVFAIAMILLYRWASRLSRTAKI